MNIAAAANPRVAIGNNSRTAEITELVNTLRIELETYEMTPLWRARWEMLIDQTLPTPDKLIGLIMSFFQEFRGRADPGVKLVEALSNLADRRVRLGVKLHEERGFLVKERGGHRGQPSVYSVQIPEKTLLELAERRHADAAFNEKGGTGGTLMPPMPPFKGGTGGTLMPPFPAAYIDIKNNNNINNTDASAEELVHVNGVSISGPGFEISYKEIENAAFLGSSTFERGKAMAIILANDWAKTGKIPDRPIAMLVKALRGDQIRLEEHKHKLKRTLTELDQPQAQKPPPAQPAWIVDRDKERAKSRKHADVIAELSQKHREGKL